MTYLYIGKHTAGPKETEMIPKLFLILYINLRQQMNNFQGK